MMSQQADLLPLNIKKRRGGNDAGSTDVEPISQTTQWLRELIEKNKNGQRVMSPLTEKKARQIVASLEGIGEDLDTADTPAVQALRGTLSGLKAEMTRRIDTDSKFAECREKLEKLSKDGFFLRYGDYFANAVGDLRKMALEVSKEAKKIQKKETTQKGEESTRPDSENDAMKIFLTQSWINIDKILTFEENQLQSSTTKLPTPMTTLIENLAVLAKIPVSSSTTGHGQWGRMGNPSEKGQRGLHRQPHKGKGIVVQGPLRPRQRLEKRRRAGEKEK